MSDSIWEKYEEIFPLVADLPENEREAHLRQLCAGDEELRREILALLKADEKVGQFIESPIALPDSLSQVFCEVQTEKLFSTARVGSKFGAYRALVKLGSGGMGAVYLAERADGEFRKKVAIKLVKNGADTDFNLRRFRHERQILAQLEHPNIARLLDGGTTEDGSPYLVMEYVEGKTLFDFCNSRQLDLRERLNLFRQICQAVEYAHKNGVIHRDIKPGNILVNETGTVKLLDFGIAKILDSDFAGDSIEQTATMMRQMTPEYASPEQIKGEAITPASDVYSLGVCLYELLTGERPYKFSSRAPHEVARIICEQAVKIPKLEIQTEPADDLKFIVLKSLQKKTSDRYVSVADFDSDIAKFLEGTPVLTEDKRLDFFEKAIADSHGESVSPAVAPFQILTAENAKNTEAERLEKIKPSRATEITDNFNLRPTGEVEPSGGFKTRRIFAAAAVLICAVVVVAASLKIVLFQKTDEPPKVVYFKKDQSPNENPATAASSVELREESPSADAVANELYKAGKQQLEPRTLDGVNRAIKLFTEAAKRDPNFALAFSGLADAHIILADKDDKAAAAAYRTAEEHALKALALDPDLAEARTSLAMTTYKNTGNFAAAEKHFLRAIEINPSLSRAHHWYSQLLRASERNEEALREITIAAELEPRSAVIHYNVGIANLDLRRYPEAIANFDKAIELDGNYVKSYLTKAIAQQMLGDYNAALETYRIGRIYSGKDENEPFWILMQAQTHAANKRRDESLALLNRLLRNPAQREETANLPFDIALVYNLLGDADAACKWLEKIELKKVKTPEAIGKDPRFANLRGNPRFERLVEKWRNLMNASKK